MWTIQYAMNGQQLGDPEEPETYPTRTAANDALREMWGDVLPQCDLGPVAAIVRPDGYVVTARFVKLGETPDLPEMPAGSERGKYNGLSRNVRDALSKLEDLIEKDGPTSNAKLVLQSAQRALSNAWAEFDRQL